MPNPCQTQAITSVPHPTYHWAFTSSAPASPSTDLSRSWDVPLSAPDPWPSSGPHRLSSHVYAATMPAAYPYLGYRSAACRFCCCSLSAAARRIPAVFRSFGFWWILSFRFSAFGRWTVFLESRWFVAACLARVGPRLAEGCGAARARSRFGVESRALRLCRLVRRAF